MAFKWFTVDRNGKGRVFTTDGFIPKNIDPLIDITNTDFKIEDGIFLVLINGRVEVDLVKKAAYDQALADKLTRDEARRTTEKTLVEQLKLANTVIDNSSLEAPIKTLLKRMCKLLARDL